LWGRDFVGFLFALKWAASPPPDLDRGDGLHEVLLAAGPQTGEKLAQPAIALPDENKDRL
jgi:hypothetical protein